MKKESDVPMAFRNEEEFEDAYVRFLGGPAAGGEKNHGQP